MKKAQVKMGETIAILFIFFILLIVGAVFYMNMTRVSVSRDISEFKEQKAVELSQIISFLPEVRCTEANVAEAGCFDLYKLIAMSEISKTPEGMFVYNREFETTKINIKVLYPVHANWTIYERQKGNFTSASTMNIPISLYNASADSYYFGLLEVTVYG